MEVIISASVYSLYDSGNCLTKIKFIFILTFYIGFVKGQSNFTIINESYSFKSEFVNDSYLIINGDSLVFKFSDNTSTIKIDHVWAKDKDMIWVLYKNQGMHDFWNSYCRQFNYNKEDFRTAKKKLIDRFFKDHQIDLAEIIIYRAAIKPQVKLLCGTCYDWTDFLFKIKATQLKQLATTTHTELLNVKNNYH